MHTLKRLEAPRAAKKPKALTIHEDTRTDNYYWLNERENEEVIQYLKSENDYKEKVMKPLKPFQEKLYQEIIARLKPDEESVPYKDNGYYYLSRYEKGKEHPIYSRKKESLETTEEVMLDENELAKPHNYYNIGGRSVSPDNRLLVFGEDTISRRIFTLRFKNLETGEMLKDAIPGTSGSAAWANDNKTIFYAAKDPTTLRTHKVFRHVLGTPVEEDVEVFHEDDPAFRAFVYKSKSRKYIIIGSYSTLSHEYRVLDADTPGGEFRVIHPREKELEYDIAHHHDKFYIRTNLDARNFRLMVTSEDATTKENWKELIPHREDVLLEDMDIFEEFLVLSERKNGITQLRVRQWKGPEHYINFGEEAYLAYVSINPDFDTDWLRIGYTSLTTPNTTYDYNMRSKELKMLKQQEVIGSFKPEDYHSERLYATARDGARIPISMVYRKGFRKDGNQPLLLYGYGSYGHSMEPYFSSVRLSLLDRGFAFAIAHVRGGEEMGRHWYEDGKLLKKKNTFTDFIDCAEYLLKNQYCSPEKLFAMGGSAGGLLMGAIVNLRPELWSGIVAAVPFVDVVTTMLDDTIPLTTGEYDEWGNPNEKKYYEYIKSYSPYDNVEAKDYPPMMVTTGLHDSQVQYWEPAKWVAKLRELKTDDNPLLLHTNMEAGHSGASGRYRRYEETAMEYAFLLSLAGLAEEKVPPGK
ncbi:MAG: S9 family peptidase [Phaeodactylibacter sp.]|nr:S9 family peptidase [Phaeodactylibacter sp.]MCB9265560.1 S9 family peptidase [Lewinellaceae bacterium]MCB9288479.1 S9 family peptidase [Lewinellaceae bacterium]